jgi:hypothetical protein
MPKRHGKSEEEKVAEKIAKELKDSTMNLDEVGKYLGRMIPSYLLKRLEIVVESGNAEREGIDLRQGMTPLF